MATASFAPIGPLCGRVRVPGDKSISHRALIAGALANGRSRVTGRSSGDDVARTRAALEACGARFADAADGALSIDGSPGLSEPLRPIDVGNSGTSMRLLVGVLAAYPFLSVLVGDDSIHRRPMERVVRPLRAMGARIDGRDDGRLAPLVVRGGGLVGIDYATPVPSAQVKSAILLAGLGASGETVVREAVPTRPHTEEILALAGHPARVTEAHGLHTVAVEPGILAPFEIDVPGDPSQAAFLAVAAAIVPGSEIVIENVYVGPSRAGFITILKRMGAQIDLEPRDATTADLHVRASALEATDVAGREVADAIDELPVLAIAAAHAHGVTTIRDAAELRVKESDRIETTAAGLRALGVGVETGPDALAVTGGVGPGDARVDAHGDHRIAMAFAIAGLAHGGSVEIAGFEAVATSWPGFADLVGALACR